MPVSNSGPDFIVNTTAGSNQGSPATTALADGRLVMVWYSNDGGDGSGACIRGRIFDSAGQPLGNDFVVNSTGSSLQSEPMVVGLPDGRFVVSWYSQDGGDGSGQCVRARGFDVDGQPVGDDFIVNSTTTGSQGSSSMVLLADGGLFVTWYSGDSGDGSGACIRGRFLNADGSPVGDDFIVNTTAAGHQFWSNVTVLTDGRLVVTWYSADGGDGSGTCIRARIIGADGEAIGDDFIVNTTGSGVQGLFGPSITALADGGFVAVWASEETGDGSGYCVRGRVFDADGVPTGDDFILNTTTSGAQEQPAVVALADGRFVAVWESHDDGPGDGDLACIRARLFNADGSVAGDDFLVNSTIDHTQLGPEVAALADGRFVVSWTSYDSTGDGSASTARARIFDPTVFNGTAADDIWLGGSLTDHITGAEGADTLSGLGGDDFLTGGSGDDALDGGDGADQLFGGGGADILDGGAGDDKAFGGAGVDQLVGGAGDDALDGGLDEDTISYASAVQRVVVSLAAGTARGADIDTDTLSSIENVVGGAGSDVITGDGAANSLFGGTGVDRLAGLDGDDSLSGEAGSDAIFGGFGADTIDGGADNDRINGNPGADELSGGTGEDAILGGGDNDTIFGGDGNDDLSGQSGNDAMSGGDDDDRLHGGGDNDTLDGDAGDDDLYGSDGDDVLHGGTNDDYLHGGGGNDEMHGDGQSDILHGYDGDDVIYGGIGNDELNGSAGADQLFGGDNADTVMGAAGDDVVDGGAGNDYLTGGTDADTFVFAVGYQQDQAAGFQDDLDTIQFDDALWGGVSTTAAQVLADYATQTTPGIVTFDFGGGDTFTIVQGSGITVAALENDILII